LEALNRGAKVAAVDINPTTLDETATLASAVDRFSPIVVDITDKDAVAALPAQVEARFGSVDGLIHCAGIIQPFVKVKDLDDEAIERVFRINWWGTLYLDRAFLPVLLARPTGHIVNVSSMGGFLPVPGQAVYGASKAAVKLLTEALYAECRGTSVRVTLVIPGGVATNITTNSGVAIPIDEAAMAGQARKVATPEQAAKAILDGVEKNAYRVLIGRDAKLMDVVYRLNPKRAATMIASQMKDLLRD
jgi:short-subunit dehydrogenase